MRRRVVGATEIFVPQHIVPRRAAELQGPNFNYRLTPAYDFNERASRGLAAVDFLRAFRVLQHGVGLPNSRSGKRL